MKLNKVSTENAEHFIWGDKCDGWFLAKHPSACIIQETMLPHTAEKKHYHEKTWQFIFVLSGNLTIEIGETEYQLSELEGIEMPEIIPHNFYNKTDKNIIYILIAAPNVEGDRINLE